jgi:hypothetical protein
MGTKRDTVNDRMSRHAKKAEDEARFEAWLQDFDACQADLTARLDAVLQSLGVDPAKVSEPA